LKEARGYAVAEYQEFLEKQWIEELAKKYKLVVNKDVLKSIVK
jgi:peptidyl-prolyl cis-trans isomerase SurA